MEVRLSLLSVENAVTKFFWDALYYLNTRKKTPVYPPLKVSRHLWVGNNYFAVCEINSDIVFIPISMGDYEAKIEHVPVTYIKGKISGCVYRQTK
jgi:hypothetical protein